MGTFYVHQGSLLWMVYDLSCSPYTRQLSGNSLPTMVVGNELPGVCYKLPTIYCMHMCNLLPEVDPWSTPGNRLPERSNDLLKNYH